MEMDPLYQETQRQLHLIRQQQLDLENRQAQANLSLRDEEIQLDESLSKIAASIAAQQSHDLVDITPETTVKIRVTMVPDPAIKLTAVAKRKYIKQNVFPSKSVSLQLFP